MKTDINVQKNEAIVNRLLEMLDGTEWKDTGRQAGRCYEAFGGRLQARLYDDYGELRIGIDAPAGLEQGGVAVVIPAELGAAESAAYACNVMMCLAFAYRRGLHMGWLDGGNP